MTHSDLDSERNSDWKYLGEEVKRRTIQPFSNTIFVLYAFLAIILLGCLGIWVELYKYAFSDGVEKYDGLMTAVATFYPALVGSAAIHLALSSTGREYKVFVALAFLVSFVVIGSVVLISAIYKISPGWCLFAAIIITFFSVWFWWFTYGDDPTYKPVPVDAAAGGDIRRELKGNTSGFVE